MGAPGMEVELEGGGQPLTPCAPTVVEAMAAELQAQRMHKVIPGTLMNKCPSTR